MNFIKIGRNHISYKIRTIAPALLPNFKLFSSNGRFQKPTHFRDW